MSGLLVSIYLFVLATFVGWQIITKIPPTLHTPLMSGANAVSGITIVGALVACHGGSVTLSNVLGSLAVVFAMINVVGDHATYHLQHDAPLTSDIESLAHPMSHFVRRIATAEDVGPAIEEAYVASLTLPGVTTVMADGMSRSCVLRREPASDEVAA